MELSRWQIGISALWVVLSFNYVAYIMQYIALWQHPIQAGLEAARFSISAFFYSDYPSEFYNLSSIRPISDSDNSATCKRILNFLM
ncbi:MAG: hypothetical protein JXA73_13015, partial [Acidobacteria bacterium]|nr:hypothetical protein [Acidobacteriota bacterium]